MKKFTLFLFAVITVLSLNASVVTDPVEKSKNATTAVSEEKEMVLDNAAVTDAMREFKSLSRVDKKMRMRQVKAILKDYKAQKKVFARSTEDNPAPAPTDTNTLLLVILAILLPPLAVALHEGGINGKFWISLLLTLLFWIPGVIYALIVVL
jgi:uncharacterized membrane protein YqaE (UPF0057 family)